MKYLSLLLLSLVLLSCEEKKTKAEGPVIKLITKNAQFPRVFLVGQSGDNFDTLSTTELTSETIEIPYTAEYPELMYLAFENFSRPLQVFVDEDGVQVEIDFSINPPDKKITGSEYNDKLEEFFEIETVYNNGMRNLQPLRVQAQADPIIAEILKTKEDSIYKSFKYSTLDFCYKSDVVGAFIANRRIFDITHQQADSVYQNILAKHRKSPEVVALKEKIEILKRTAVGQPTVNISQGTVNGALIELDQVVKQNEYTLLHFWASWHQSARLANLLLKETYDTYHAKGFEIYSVSLDEDNELWQAAILQDSLAWPNVSTLNGIENEAAKQYGIYYLPQTVLINKNGIIEVKNLSTEDLDAYLTQNLN